MGLDLATSGEGKRLDGRVAGWDDSRFGVCWRMTAAQSLFRNGASEGCMLGAQGVGGRPQNVFSPAWQSVGEHRFPQNKNLSSQQLIPCRLCKPTSSAALLLTRSVVVMATAALWASSAPSPNRPASLGTAASSSYDTRHSMVKLLF